MKNQNYAKMRIRLCYRQREKIDFIALECEDN